MATVFFVTHPEVVIDPAVAVPQWPLSAVGRARMQASLRAAWVREVGCIVASTERKAVDAAEILAAGLGIGFSTLAALGENDRSATGYLPRPEFEAVADAFFAQPDVSVHGWERAVDAQLRIVTAFETAISLSPDDADLAIVSHGAVGALLLCHLEGLPIRRSEEQPAAVDPRTGHTRAGGFVYAIDRQTRLLRHGWVPIDTDGGATGS